MAGLVLRRSLLLKLITFFSYSGFYAGLALMVTLGYGEEGSRIYSLPMRFLLVVFMVTFILLGKRKKNKTPFEVQLIYFFWIVYILKVYWLSNFTNSELSKNDYEYIFYTIAFCALPFITFKAIDLRDHGNIILDYLIFSGFVLGITGMFLYGDLLTKGVGRISIAKYMDVDISAVNPLILSYTSALTIGLVIHKFTFLKGMSFFYKLYLLITAGTSLAMFLLGASRGSVLALAFSMLLFIWFGPFKNKVRFIGLIIVFFPVLFWSAVKSGSSVFTRLYSIQSDIEGNVQIENSRLYLWKNAWDEFTSYPFLGGNIELKGEYPHNFIIEVLMSTGILGIFLFVPILFGAFNRGIKLIRKDSSFMWVMILFVQAFVHYNFSGALYTDILLFIAVGILYSFQRNLK